MTNNFTITNPEKTLLISIQWENDIAPEDKERVHQMVLQALELWEAKEKFSEAAQQALSDG